MYREISVLSLAMLFGCVAGAAVTPTPAVPAIDAAWAEHQIDFHFFGNDTGKSTYYTCDGIEQKLRALLRMAGARRDAYVVASGCGFGTTDLSTLIMVHIRFHSPSLAQPADAAAAPESVAAHWNTQKLRLGWTNGFDAGDCQLVDQFRLQVLKQLAVRNVTADLDCSVRAPAARGRSSLAFEALTATPTAEAESIERERQPKKHDDQLKSERN